MRVSSRRVVFLLTSAPVLRHPSHLKSAVKTLKKAPWRDADVNVSALVKVVFVSLSMQASLKSIFPDFIIAHRTTTIRLLK